LLIFVLLPIPPIPPVISHLTTCNIFIIEGPVEKTGATGSLFSIYIRDPDGNLIEIAIEIKA
jgi:catechol 2,3-dioxygenase-like lactoylglutathione lyase family enzyme